MDGKVRRFVGRGIVRGIVAVEILMIGVMPVGTRGWGIRYAYADSPGSTTCPGLAFNSMFGGASCESNCNNVNAASASPNPSGSPSSTPTFDSTVSACGSNTNVNQMASCYCDALCRLNDAITWDIVTAAMYTVAGSACTAACAATIASAGIASGLSTACTAAGIAALGVDIGAEVKLTKDGQDAAQQWISALDIGGGAAAVGATIAGTQVLNTINKGSLRSMMKSIGKNVGGNPFSETAESGFGSKGKSAGSSSESSAGDTATKAALCVSAVMYLAIAGTKFGMIYSSMKSARDSTCNSINSLFPSGVGGGGIGSGNLQNNNPTLSAGPISQASSPVQSFAQQASQPIQKAQDAIAQGLQNAATAGGITPDSPAGQNLQNLGNQLSSQLPQVANGLANGQSPAGMAGGMMPQGTPSAAHQALKDLDAASKQHPLVEFSGNSTYSGGGGHVSKSGSSGGGDFLNFGNLFNKDKPDGGAGKAKEIAFGSQNKPAKPILGTDIWHQGFRGSIFDIISVRLDQDRDQVTQMEWATPLNRALMGLPKLAPNAPVKEVAPQNQK